MEHRSELAIQIHTALLNSMPWKRNHYQTTFMACKLENLCTRWMYLYI
uniref:Uncharacterized protein n=1 Tax=Rhizophora mucronata TaxID=61149 RepID=A0A2P2PR48_RHIMU